MGLCPQTAAVWSQIWTNWHQVSGTRNWCDIWAEGNPRLIGCLGLILINHSSYRIGHLTVTLGSSRYFGKPITFDYYY